jgi:hypothetical protein
MRLSLINMGKITILRKLSYHSDYRIIGVSHHRGFTVFIIYFNNIFNSIEARISEISALSFANDIALLAPRKNYKRDIKISSYSRRKSDFIKYNK